MRKVFYIYAINKLTGQRMYLCQYVTRQRTKRYIREAKRLGRGGGRYFFVIRPRKRCNSPYGRIVRAPIARGIQ